jgi:two-component sensor histidine kinase
LPSRTYRILQIDDDAALARLVEKALKRRGFAYIHTGDPEQGMARVAEGGIDVVVLDHFLGGSTGTSVLASLRESHPTLPVVYVTGSQEPTVAVEALKAGAADYVIKTVGEEFLLLLTNAVEQAIEKARLERLRELAELEVRDARDRAEILLQEVNHRVANSLALAAALVRMQAAAVSDPTAKDALNETQARISAIAGLHRRLYTSDDVRSVSLDSYLTTLVEELDTTMKAAGHQSRVKLDLDPLTVPTDKAVSIGMIVTELLTNAYKYAYPLDAAGEVRIQMRRGQDNRATLVVEDDGVGWDGSGPAKGTGLGTRIVAAMASQLGTTISYGDGAAGTRTSMELPIETA